MSTIQTQIGIVHIESGLGASSAIQRTSTEDGFSSSSISVSTVDEVVQLGDISTPKQILLKLVSGDQLMVGFASGTYPLRLKEASESMLLRLDVEGIVEISTVTAIADVASSLSGYYFDTADRTGPVRVWFNTGASASPAVPSAGRLVAVQITPDSDATVVASSIAAALDADPEFSASSNASLVTISDVHTGTRTSIATASSGMTVARIQTGQASPVIHLKSTGTSQVVVAVSPA